MDAFKKSLGSTMGKLVACGGCLFLVVIGIVIIAAAGSSASKSSTNPTSVPANSDNTTLATTQATSTASAVKATPQVLLDLTGSGSKTTQKFTTASDWDLNWSYDCTKFAGGSGNFQVFVYQGEGTMSLDNAGVNQLGASGTDVEHYHTGGTFYLTVNSECPWHITAKG